MTEFNCQRNTASDLILWWSSFKKTDVTCFHNEKTEPFGREFNAERRKILLLEIHEVVIALFATKIQTKEISWRSSGNKWREEVPFDYTVMKFGSLRVR